MPVNNSWYAKSKLPILRPSKLIIIAVEEKSDRIRVRLTSVKDKSTEMTPELTAATHATANELLLDIQSTLEAVCCFACKIRTNVYVTNTCAF
jgi:hypothetical protein